MPVIRAPSRSTGAFQPIDFGHTSNPGQSGLESAMRLVNGYVEPIGSKSKTPDPVYAVPGTVRFDKVNPFSGGACRGMLYVPDQGLFVVCGSQVAVFDKQGSGTLIPGSVSGIGPVFMAANLATNPQIAIVADQSYYVLNTALNTVALQNNTNLPPPNSVCAIDGYLVFSIPDGRIFHTALNDAYTLSALAFGTIGSAPYALRRVATYRNYLVLMGEGSIEAWTDAGTLPFAFAPSSTSFNIGCLAASSVALVANSDSAAGVLLWVDSDGRVVEFGGTAPRVVSTPAVERAIQGLTAFQKSSLSAVVTHHAGHDFYALSSIYWTWELDLKTGLWHERQSRGRANWFASGWANYGGLHIVGSCASQALHQISQDAVTEAGTPFPFAMQSEPITAFPDGLIFDEVRVDAIVGSGRTNAGATAADVDAQDPQLLLSWSDDGGRTWTGPRSAPLGPVGQRNTPVSFHQLGSCGREGRVLRLECASNVSRGVFLVSARLRTYKV